jgi:hypothetical protein
MATSQNAYSVLFDNRIDGGLPRLRKWVVPGADRHFLLRDGSAGFLLVHVAHWFDAEIERLDTGQWDDWGWAVRPIRGQSTGYSNHASGTAIDLNAVRHPRGKATASTFTGGQIDAIRRRLKMYDGCLRWGGDYQSTPDGMHFEIDQPLKDCERVARALLERPRSKRILDANPGAREVILS